MRLKITVDDLRRVGACNTNPFQDVYGDCWEGDWTPEMQVEFLKGPLRAHFFWATHTGLLPVWKMVSADFRECDLSGAAFGSVNLTRAGLQKANLTRAYLEQAWLGNACVAGTNFTDANLVRAMLNSVWGKAVAFNRINADCAGFTSARLLEADFEGAILSHASFWHADLFASKFVAAVATGAYFYKARLTCADLSRASLRQADLRRATLTDAILTDTDLTGALRLPEDPPIPGWILDESGHLKRDAA
jgi:hypothetical protein